MKIKKKLFLGFGLLFAVVLILGAVSIYYIEVISEVSNVTLKNNYETLIFTRDMRSVLDENELPLTAAATSTFDNALKKQENNITEPGEKEATTDLRKAFNSLIAPSINQGQKQQIERNARQLLNKIEGLNMKAIIIKNAQTHKTVTNATLLLGGMGFITFLILFILIANFPGFILDPVNELTEVMGDISEGNYNVRMSTRSTDEFARLAESFNKMAASLDNGKNTRLSKVIAEEQRIKALIEEMQDGVIGINAREEIIFLNAAAKKDLSLGEKHIIGQSINDLKKGNNSMRVVFDNNNNEKTLQLNINNKVAYFQLKKLEIVVPNLKPDLNAFQVAGYADGMIYVLKNVS